MMTHTLKKNIQQVRAFAPATCANVAVGFDILGFALADIGDTVTLERSEDQGVHIKAIHAHEDLPLSPDKNTASAVVQYFCDDLGLSQQTGFTLTIEKGIALGSGMGGSAASAVAALACVNRFLEKPLPLQALIKYALLGEQVAVGTAHSDNIIPCLLGGMTLTHTLTPLDVVQLPVPDVLAVIIHPHLRLDTKASRAALSDRILLTEHVKQSAHLASFIAALYQNDLDLLARALQDELIEPKRAALIPGFAQVKQAALKQRALGASLSGSGPSLFALARNQTDAGDIAASCQDAFKAQNINSDVFISKISPQGVNIIDTV